MGRVMGNAASDIWDYPIVDGFGDTVPVKQVLADTERRIWALQNELSIVDSKLDQLLALHNSE
jgi:hypothetical protein